VSHIRTIWNVFPGISCSSEMVIIDYARKVVRRFVFEFAA